MTSRMSVRRPPFTYCWGGDGEAGEPLGTGVFGQFSLAGNRVAALHLATRVFLVGNHINDEQRDKEQESRRKAKEHETRGDKLKNLSEESFESSRGRRRRENLNEKHARDKTQIYNMYFFS